ADVRWDLFTATDHTTVCPFKGRATYWSLTGVTPQLPNVAWTYRTPLPEVAELVGHVSFYDKALRVVVAQAWPYGTTVPSKFPLWGYADELVRLIDVEPVGENRYMGPAHGPTHRNVVEGGQLLAEAIVAVSKSLPDQRVTSATMVFTKAASFEKPVDVTVDL